MRLLPALFIFHGLSLAEEEVRPEERLWGYSEGIALIGAVLAKNPTKTANRNVLLDVKDFAESLNQARGLNESEQRKILQNLLGIGDMKMNISQKLTTSLRQTFTKAEKDYRDSLGKQIQILQDSNKFPDPVKGWVDQNLITPLKETRDLLEAYLADSNQAANRKKLNLKMEDEKVIRIGRKFYALVQEAMGKLQAYVLLKKTFNFKDFEGLTNVLLRAQVVYNTIEVMRESLTTGGDGGKVNRVIEDQKTFRNTTIEEIDKWKNNSSQMEFNYNAINITDDGFENGLDLKTIFRKFSGNKWSDGEPLNYYYLLVYDNKPSMKLTKAYTHVNEINNRTLVLHMKSKKLDDDPKSSDHKWFNWYPPMLQTLEFAIRDDLSRVNPFNKTAEDLLKQVHKIAVDKCKVCPTVLTSIDGPNDSYTEGKDPPPAGRLFRIFEKISVFIGF